MIRRVPSCGPHLPHALYPAVRPPSGPGHLACCILIPPPLRMPSVQHTPWASPVIFLLPLHLHPPTHHLQFTFYAAYHDNTINKWIHIFCIWPLLFTALICLWAIPHWFLSYAALPPALAAKLSVHGVQLTVNWALLISLGYVFFYLSLEAKNFKKMTGLGIFAVGLW